MENVICSFSTLRCQMPRSVSRLLCEMTQCGRRPRKRGKAMFGQREWHRAAVATLLVCLGTQASFAAVTGRISGTVKDPTGEVVPSADVTALETQTGISNATRTELQGFCYVPSHRVAH